MRIKNVLAIACLSLALSGCGARVGTVTNTPTGVTQNQVKNWYAATGAFTEIASVNHEILAGVIQFHDGGTWTDTASYEITLRSLGRIDQIQIEASTFLKTVPDNWGQSTQAKIKSYTDEISTEIQKINAAGATGIKNPESLKKINTLIDSFTKVVDLIFSLITKVQP